MNVTQKVESAHQKAGRVCYACDEGYCAHCTGWERTVIDGQIVMVACSHECRAERKKAVRGVATAQPKMRRA